MLRIYWAAMLQGGAGTETFVKPFVAMWAKGSRERRDVGDQRRRAVLRRSRRVAFATAVGGHLPATREQANASATQ